MPAVYSDFELLEALPVLRSRRTAALCRIVAGLAGAALAAGESSLLAHPLLGVIGFSLIALTSLVQLAMPRTRWLGAEETLSALGGLLIIGLGDEHVNVLSFLWLTAAASGVLARGGRQHWLGRVILLASLALPAARLGEISSQYGALCVASVCLLLAAGRVTRELSEMLDQEHERAGSARSLLAAGDLAARMASRSVQRGESSAGPGRPGGDGELAAARGALELLLGGKGITTLVQPIVDLATRRAHAFEALSRFTAPGLDGGPLQWLELAEELGQRPELERACLRSALALYAQRPAGMSLSVNVSAPVLAEAPTRELFIDAARRDPDGLSGLIVEITEETLACGQDEVIDAFEPLLAFGACMAVDDVGAGYSGLRQILEVRPRYLKLDRSLVSGIDGDADRAALVRALVGYSRQVGCHLIAEGVESVAELEAVRALGCVLVQGYVFSRPVSPWPSPPFAAPAPDGEPTVRRGADIQPRQRAHSA